MCGITGVVARTEKGKRQHAFLDSSMHALEKRGPDGGGKFISEFVALGHRRLVVIDTSEGSMQPLTDATNRYTIVYNGECFNYQELKLELTSMGVTFKSVGDTEVLLKAYMHFGVDFVKKINGFFSLAIYDNIEHSLYIARDRYGIKPLYLYCHDDFIAFASNLRALLAYEIPKKVNDSALIAYLQLNYLPFSESMIKDVIKVSPGNYLVIKNGSMEQFRYYSLPSDLPVEQPENYEQAKLKVAELLEDAVVKRLVSDVPLGCFLSGGIDSSIVAAIAAKHTPHLKTFSIGYSDEPYFDETHYAQLVASKHNTDHTVFSLRNTDLFDHFDAFIESMDEPFADSSALAFSLLSKYTRKEVTVALSGDGADELFAGYNKHAAELAIRNYPQLALLKPFSWLFSNLVPSSRNSFISNKVRQLHKLCAGANLSMQDRYWLWASIASEADVLSLLKTKSSDFTYKNEKNELLGLLTSDFNSVLHADMKLVLQGDMLVKVDSMSMANSLEVRVPFLDYRLVNYVFNLPSSFKIDGKVRKRILKDAFRNELPPELLTRGKHGFEVPMLKWLRTDLKDLIVNDLLAPRFIESQGIFEPSRIKQLVNKLFSNNPEDSAARIWALVIFQLWWKKID